MPSPDSDPGEVARLRLLLEQERSARSGAEEIADCAAKEREKLLTEVSLLEAVTRAANEAKSIEEAVRTAMHRICQFKNWPLGHALFCRKAGDLELVSGKVWHVEDPVFYGVFRGMCEEATYSDVAELPVRVMKSMQPEWSATLPAGPRGDQGRTAGLQSAFAMPVLNGGRVAGVLEFYAGQMAEPDVRWIELCKRMGLQLGNVIERQHAIEEVQRVATYYRHLTDNALDIITVLNGDGTIRFENPSIEQVLGHKPEDYVGKSAFDFVHPEDIPRVMQAFMEALQKNGNTPALSFRFRHKDGSWRILEGIGNNLLADPIVAGIVFNSRDVTERRRLEEQYLQSQKVAVVGRLAGGVAHDFNNILTAIICYTELVLKNFSRDNPFYGSVVEIKNAADRATSLTRQLLAFSRKQVLQPTVIDVNEALHNMESLLRRVIGEDIELTILPRITGARVCADLTQIEQVILNMVVNARAAMPRGGKLTIETSVAQLDEKYAQTHVEVQPGEYAVIAITDTGTGMTPEIVNHLFEPFFTTKPTGHGTGLGLATCHGVVKQSGGHISVYTEVGIGSTFRVYLPRVDLPASTPTHTSSVVTRGWETILLVEDDPVLRDLGSYLLREKGYTILEATDGKDALRVVREYQGKIHLLLTDVIMPLMSGRELVDKLHPEYPQMKVLYCSGYTQDAIANHGVLEPDVHFLQKPFTNSSLANKVRDVLDH